MKDNSHKKKASSLDKDLSSTTIDAVWREDQSLDTPLGRNEDIHQSVHREGPAVGTFVSPPEVTRNQAATVDEQEEAPRSNLHSSGEAGEKVEHYGIRGEPLPINPLMSGRRIPKGYTTIEQAHQALNELLQISSMDRRGKRRDIIKLSQGDVIKLDPRNVSFSVDTSIDLEEIETMTKKTNKLRLMLDGQQLFLLERQAEIVHLRMSIVNTMMEFEARSSIIRKNVFRLLQGGDQGSPMSTSIVMNSSWSSTDALDGTQCSGQSLHASWPLCPPNDLSGSESQHSIDMKNHLSWDIHTIEEIQEDSSDSSLAIQAVDSVSSIVSQIQPTRLASPPVRRDRWDMSFNTPLTSNLMQFEPNGGRIISSMRRRSFPNDIIFPAISTSSPTTSTRCEGQQQQQQSSEVEVKLGGGGDGRTIYSTD
jgi:hypothetical protein